MHNGVFAALEDVMMFYNNGGGSGLNIAPETQTLPADKLNLTGKRNKSSDRIYAYACGYKWKEMI